MARFETWVWSFHTLTQHISRRVMTNDRTQKMQAKVEVRKTTPYNHRGFEHGQRDGQNAALNHSLAI
ncbi:hypothetical protein PBI_ROSALIND_86 [Gordonia phage Rosalind]|uniref:hypothetical protein n=1 Tax=Gordonia phage Rosalind TaxID=1838077 RepID=UPI0007B64E45|nr:hypothetical protein BEN61_gp025 [Gordonia phage Rosalind]ANA87119.1 hypothetical protein PBI_ROSALIND_86 [Gordonia phage Rosalind]